ncbi:hypothetical protein ABMC89_09910 [Sulfitobacter sp. HNIBRBA3233]
MVMINYLLAGLVGTMVALSFFMAKVDMSSQADPVPGAGWHAHQRNFVM